MQVQEKLTELVEQYFTEEPELFAGFFLVELNVHANKKVEVFIDSDQGVQFQHCQKMSRYLEAYLDEEVWVDEKYTLEVSSPGVDRPLKLPRQYVKNIGRKVHVTPQEGKVVKGILAQADENKFVVTFKQKVKEGKKKREVTVEQPFSYHEVLKTVVKISF